MHGSSGAHTAGLDMSSSSNVNMMMTHGTVGTLGTIDSSAMLGATTRSNLQVAIDNSHTGASGLDDGLGMGLSMGLGVGDARGPARSLGLEELDMLEALANATPTTAPSPNGGGFTPGSNWASPAGNRKGGFGRDGATGGRGGARGASSPQRRVRRGRGAGGTQLAVDEAALDDGGPGTGDPPEEWMAFLMSSPDRGANVGHASGASHDNTRAEHMF